MSAPLVVNTRDGVCWTRRTVTPGGIALYAPESVRTCPDFVMATLPELAEHGIVGSADALPVPVGPEPSGREAAKARVRAKVEAAKAMPARERIYHLLCATHTHAEAEAMLDEVAAYGVNGQRLIRDEQRRAELEAVLGTHRKDDQAEIERLKARVSELEAERHVTNEALDDAVQELRTPYAERARRETHPGRRQAWRMLAQVEESERVANVLLTPEAARSADKLTQLLAPTQALLEDPHDSPLAHTYRVGRDLPETGGAR
jgi:hypothetical protein